MNHFRGYHLVPSSIQPRDITCSILYSSDSSIRIVSLTVIKFFIIFIFVEFSIKKFFQSCSATTGFTPMHDAFVGLSAAKIYLFRYLYVKSQSIVSTGNTTFWWALQTQTEWVICEPARIHHLGIKAQNVWNPIFTFGCSTLKALYNSCKLKRLLLVAKFLIMYSFTHTNILSAYLLKLSSL